MLPAHFPAQLPAFRPVLCKLVASLRQLTCKLRKRSCSFGRTPANQYWHVAAWLAQRRMACVRQQPACMCSRLHNEACNTEQQQHSPFPGGRDALMMLVSRFSTGSNDWRLGKLRPPRNNGGMHMVGVRKRIAGHERWHCGAWRLENNQHGQSSHVSLQDGVSCSVGNTLAQGQYRGGVGIERLVVAEIHGWFREAHVSGALRQSCNQAMWM